MNSFKEKIKIISKEVVNLHVLFITGCFSFLLAGSFPLVVHADSVSASAWMDFDSLTRGGTAVLSAYPLSLGCSYSEGQAFNDWYPGDSLLEGGEVGKYDIEFGAKEETSASYTNFNSTGAGKTHTDGQMTAISKSTTLNVGSEHSVNSYAIMCRTYKVTTGGTVTFSGKYTSNAININATNGYGWGNTLGYLLLDYWDGTVGNYDSGMFTGFGLGWTNYSPVVYGVRYVDSGLVYHSTYNSAAQTKTVSISKNVTAGEIIGVSFGIRSRVSIYQDVPPNVPPVAPTIVGPSSGVINTFYSFNLSATDPNGDQIQYRIDLDGDGDIERWLPGETTYVNSGTAQVFSRQWLASGAKTFGVQACDSKGACSGFTSHAITISVPVYVCTGAVPANATIVPDDDAGLLLDTPITVVAADTVAKCEYVCDLGYVKDGNSCVPCSHASYSCSSSSTGDACDGATNCGNIITTISRTCLDINSCGTSTVVAQALCGAGCVDETEVCTCGGGVDYNWKEVAP